MSKMTSEKKAYLECLKKLAQGGVVPGGCGCGGSIHKTKKKKAKSGTKLFK